MKSCRLLIFLTCACACLSTRATELTLTDSPGADDLSLAIGETVGAIFVETNDEPAVLRAAGDLADDFARVTGTKPEIENQFAPDGKIRVIIGTIRKSEIIDRLAAEGKLETNGISGQWESYVLQVVKNPLPGLDAALVIAGSDRRGTIYGIYQLSEMIGVSPWYWWADVPVKQRKTIALRGDIFKQGPPTVKYRGIFINDEDWGLNPWASKTFDPQFGNIGPKTYEKVFELMLRLRLNYIWPAMHACSTEFGSVPENAALADKFAIVAGSSHCEPMLFNNVHWKEAEKGRWNYSLNRDAIHSTWEENVKARGNEEAVWTLGIRGIHDAAMERPPNDMPGKINLLGGVFYDQRELLDQYVTKQRGPVAQCFVPYKEVLPIYDAGLKVPDEVTIVWVDDNFGYIRRLGNPEEQQRSGGSGVYWHMSYYGSPHSYTWINTTAPALMWEELHKARENNTRTLWVINVGDIKPAEIGIDYFSRLAWNPDGFNLGAQRIFLHDFAARNFGEKFAPPMTDLLMEFYQLGFIRKPELMDRAWALSLTPERAVQLENDYNNLLKREEALSASVPAEARDAYTELVGFPARVLASAGLIFMADQNIQRGIDVAANESKITTVSNDLAAQVENFNTKIAGGKWNRMMPGLVTGTDLTRWSSQVRWPWGEKMSQAGQTTNNSPVINEPPAGQGWRDAATADRQSPQGAARWSIVEGLGPSGRAMTLLPASSEVSWKEDDKNAPALEYDFQTKGGDGEAFVDFLPTFRIYSGMKLRVTANMDDGVPTIIEVPGSSGSENENGPVRSFAVQNNYVRARVPLPGLTAGKHTFKIRAVDPGAVIDRVSLP
jgi:Glycosyl hydrolase family 115/Gylcosyl hydrolase family 115 C-terminal domain